MFQVMNRQHFPLSREIAYLDTAAEGLPPLASEAALSCYMREKSRGTPGRERLFEKQAEAERAAGSLLGTSPENIALLANSSEALNLLANSIPWKAGDEVLISDLEFPSNVLVWLRLKQLGVKLIVIPTEDGALRLEDWTSRLSNRTRVVSVSQVSYKTGTQIPFMDDLAAETHRAGALFCVDATQALGRVPVSLRDVDYLVASSYKWLLGTHGLGVVYTSPALRHRLEPSTVGWYSVDDVFHPQRFETYTAKTGAGQLQAGMPNFPALFALKSGIDYLLAVGVENLDRELRPLVTTLRSGLVEQGLKMLTPADEKFASGIVSFAHASPAELATKLAEKGVIVWGGDGRVRISVHLYNNEEDIHRCLSTIATMGVHGN